MQDHSIRLGISNWKRMTNTEGGDHSSIGVNMCMGENLRMTQSQDSEQPEKRLAGEEPQSYHASTEECPPPPPARDWRKLYIVISLVYANFWMAASVSLQAPFFPREAELKGATPTQYGLVFGVFELVVIIMSPIYGKLIPKISPKFLITTGVLVGGAACALFGILDYVPAGKTYIAMAFVVRIFEGFGAAALMTASFTIVAACFPDAVATSFSLMETAFGFGLIVGPTIGGALYQVGGFLLPFVVNGAFLLIGCVILFFLLPNIEDSERHEGSRNLLSFLSDGGIISFTFSIVSSLLFIGFNSATLEPHLRQANPLFINIGGYILTCVGILLIGPVPFIPFRATIWTVVGSLIVTGLGLSAKLVSSFVGALQNTIERGFPDNLATYGMVSALFSTACSTGAFIGPSLGGFLLDNTGYRMGTVVIFALDLFFLVILSGYVFFRAVKTKQVRKGSLEREPLLTASYARRSYSYSSM